MASIVAILCAQSSKGIKIDALHDRMKKEDEVKRAAETSRLIQLKSILYLLTGTSERPSVLAPAGSSRGLKIMFGALVATIFLLSESVVVIGFLLSREFS